MAPKVRLHHHCALSAFFGGILIVAVWSTDSSQDCASADVPASHGVFHVQTGAPRPETARAAQNNPCPKSVRAIIGNWIISDQQVVANENLIVNGQVQILANASLVVTNAVLEIDYPSDSFNVWSGGNTSLHVQQGGTLSLSNSSITTTQSCAMISAEAPAQINIKNCTLQNFEVAIDNASQTVIANSTLVVPPNQSIAQAIQLSNSSGCSILGNNIFPISSSNNNSAPTVGGIALLFSNQNNVQGNTIVGTVNGISLNQCSNNQIVGNSWTGPDNHYGEGAIGLQNWSNNNVIENNTLDNSGSAMLFIWQSTNNKVSNNTITNAGLGIVLRWASNTTIDGNALQHLYEDGIRAYRSYDNLIANNQITDGGAGISLFSSWNNQVEENSATTVDRGIYLFDAQTNQVQGNEFQETIQSALAVRSTNNILVDNNFINSQVAAVEDNVSGTTNTWQGNYWGNAPYKIVDSGPVSTAWPMTTFPVPPFQPIVLGSVGNDNLSISGQVIWNGQTKTINGGISIQSGGELDIEDSTVTFAPQGMERSIQISVMSGGVLHIENSKIVGPLQDHSFSIQVNPNASIVMTNSELDNAGDWVGFYGAAIGYEGSSAIIENNVFQNVYCAFSSESPASNIQFLNNTVIDSIEAFAIIGDAPNTVIDSNQFQQCAIWGIEVLSLTPGIGEVFSGNQVSDSWGMGIFDALPGVVTIDATNSFGNLKGPGIVSPEQVEARQFRPISLTPTNVQAGDEVAITFKLAPLSPPAVGVIGTSYTPSVSVNGAEIVRKTVTVANGETSVVTLEGTAPSAGVVSLSIGANWIFSQVPIVTAGPTSQTVNAGASATFMVAASGAAPTFQWYFNGVAIPDANNAILLLPSVSLVNAGSYACFVSNPSGSTLSNAALLTVTTTTNPGRLIDLSVNTVAGSGSQLMTMGFVTGGAGTTGSQTLLIRASGPALTAYGVTGAMPDPQLV